jgi:hypothetical protein
MEWAERWSAFKPTYADRNKTTILHAFEEY